MRRGFSRTLALLAALHLGAALGQDKVASPSANDRQTREARRGWHFYDDPAREAPAGPAVTPSVPAGGPPPEVVALRALQAQLEERKAVAIMRPTPANVQRYMELEFQLTVQASLFADVSQKLAWAHPELDPTTQGRPVNATALDVFEQLQVQSRAAALMALGREHVLIFYFRGDCPYCHAFAPVLRAFQDKFRIPVIPVSLDGGTVPGFESIRANNGASRALNVRQVPALFLAAPMRGRIMPVGFGVLSEGQLIERLTALRLTGDDAAPDTAWIRSR